MLQLTLFKIPTNRAALGQNRADHPDVMHNSRLMLNLGCGERTHPEWVNIDFSLRARLRAVPYLRRLFGGPNPPGYINHDLRKGIPVASGSADVVYTSHVLEHLDPEHAGLFLREAHRALRPGGVIRVVVPDLEAAARAYLDALDAWRTTRVSDAELRYEWAVILLLDQMVRSKPGGRMTPWLRQHRNSGVVRELGGIVAELAAEPPNPPNLLRRAIGHAASRRSPARTGELHRWMYDELSLARLLARCGFHDIRRVTAEESRIPGWCAFGLDLDPDGRPHQPGSIWMEATH
jgi:SAM-dependent methyltransferase